MRTAETAEAPDRADPPAAAEPAAETARVSAFQPDHVASLFADPAAMGRSILASLDGFQMQASHIRSLSQAMQSGAVAPPGPPQGAAPAMTAAQGAAGPASRPAAERQHMLGVMLETFDFAMQTEMVTRAATTFTSSVNTLIKAQ